MSNPDPDQKARNNYNRVTDLATGPNIRLRDNLFQLACALVAMAVGIVIAVSVADGDRLLMAGVGAVGGLVIGALVSGLALGIYRTFKH